MSGLGRCLFLAGKGKVGVDEESCADGGSLLVVMFCRCLICTGKANTGVGEENGDCGSSVATVFCLVLSALARRALELIKKVAMIVCHYNNVLSLSYLHWQGEDLG